VLGPDTLVKAYCIDEDGLTDLGVETLLGNLWWGGVPLDLSIRCFLSAALV
jgi:hypothetical protein